MSLRDVSPAIEHITRTKEGIKSVIYRFNLPGAPSIDVDVSNMSNGQNMSLRVAFLYMIAATRSAIRYLK